MDVEAVELKDDGRVPNNPDLALVHYRGALAQAMGTADVIRLFGDNGWRGAWVNGIFPYHHYHARSHEVLANVGAAVLVQFGGEKGPVISFEAGDVVVIPAGGGLAGCRMLVASWSSVPIRRAKKIGTSAGPIIRWTMCVRMKRLDA